MSAKQKTQQKYGRNKNFCAAYRLEHKHEKSHIRRIKLHLKRFGQDKVARSALMHAAEQVGLNAVRSAEAFIAAVMRPSKAKHVKSCYCGPAMGGTERAW
jgi:hypothetical protein